MPQLLLFPDPRPLVERLGQDFFQQAPESPGVYLMRDASDAVLYVGKAKNLRKRLASYRVANPDRMPQRHLRLLRAVARIETEKLPTESSALVRESELLRSLRPRFNRAGTWPGPPRFLCWRITTNGLDLAVASAPEPDWSSCGPMGAAAFPLRAALVRRLWCALYPERGLTQMPAGWFAGRHTEPATIPLVSASRQYPHGLLSLALSSRGGAGEKPGTYGSQRSSPSPPRKERAGERRPSLASPFEQAFTFLDSLVRGQPEPFLEWLGVQTSTQTFPFELAAKEADLETITDFARRRALTHEPLSS
jgi:hypothetical protein